MRQPIDASDHSHAAEELIEWLEQRVGLRELTAVGHRVVHGGALYTEAQPITPEWSST